MMDDIYVKMEPIKKYEAILQIVDPTYHKGQYCPKVGRTCQEGYCKECEAYNKSKEG